jgi:hypothetical protein
VYGGANARVFTWTKEEKSEIKINKKCHREEKK